jgi:hypothetical protein
MRANARLVEVTNDPVQVDSARRAHQVVLAAHVIDELLLTPQRVWLIHDYPC